MKKTISIDILERYIVNKCTPEEKILVRKWYLSLENENDYVSGLDAVDELKLEEEIYNKILSRIKSANEEEFVVPTHRRYLKLVYATAAVAAIFLIYIAIVFNNKQAVNPRIAYSIGNKEEITPSVVVLNGQQIFVVKNTSKKIYKAILPDSSSIWLSPNAEIQYPEKFDPKFRMITFSGESFFEITKNPKRPFIINSNSIITKVWGTSFRIRDGIIAKTAEVSVVTGKVSVSVRDPNKKVSARIGKAEIMLYPDQNVTLVNGQQLLKAEKIKNKASLQIWARVNLSFENASLKDIIPVLDSKFNVHLLVTNEKINNYVLNADFAGFNLPDVLQAFKKTLGIDYEINDNNNIELK
jgi:transmembrane sensor